MNSITNQIENIMSVNQGKIFSINDFYQIGTKNTVKSVLLRLNRENKIVRVMDGLYTMPKFSKILNEYSYPDVKDVAEKLADKFAWTISPTGDTALNYTGLSTQVPNEYIYISDGPYRDYVYRNKKIIFKHTTNRNITSYSRGFSVLIQAIKAIGKENICEDDIQILAMYVKRIDDDWMKDANKLPVWIQNVLERIRTSDYEQTFTVT